jgi:hypothetical protein
VCSNPFLEPTGESSLFSFTHLTIISSFVKKVDETETTQTMKKFFPPLDLSIYDTVV